MMDDHIISLIQKISSVFNGRVEHLLTDSLHISFSDYLVLSKLQSASVAQDGKGVKQEDIVKLLPFDKSTISRRLKYCEQHKLVRRQINKASEREKVVQLTPQGEATLKQAAELINAERDKVSSRLDKYIQKQMQTYLRAILSEVES